MIYGGKGPLPTGFTRHSTTLVERLGHVFTGYVHEDSGLHFIQCTLCACFWSELVVGSGAVLEPCEVALKAGGVE